MTADERIKTVIDFGFTERQARFLVLVVQHAGICVPREYASFAGIANGGKTCNAFFDKLVRRGYAVGSDCVHNRARLYHVHSKRLYYAIGEPDSRYRRPVPARGAVERLMRLDAALASPDLDWLTTDSEKVAYLTALTATKPADTSPDTPVEVASSEGLTVVPGTFPIGIDPSGRAVLLYLATEPWTDAFRRFLQAHAAVVRVLPTWTVRLVFPRPLDRVYDTYQTVIREELETPLHRPTIRELKWYFEHRRAAVDEPPGTLTQGFLERGSQVFGTPRFTLLYRRWLKHGDAVFEALSSSAIAEALNAGTGRVECVVLPHAYRHLSPLVNHVRRTPQRVEKGDRRGDNGSARSQPPPSTLSSMSSTSALL